MFSDVPAPKEEHAHQDLMAAQQGLLQAPNNKILFLPSVITDDPVLHIAVLNAFVYCVELLSALSAADTPVAPAPGFRA